MTNELEPRTRGPGQLWRLTAAALVASALTACDPSGPGDADGGPPVEESTEPLAWNFLVFMNGDNNLESWVTHDLNELEIVGPSEQVGVWVLADRSPGYDDSDGDWTDTRLYRIVQDDQEHLVTSEVVREMGELDMGDPQVLTDFLFWATDEHPALHTALVMWDHGEAWSITGMPSDNAISWDATDHNQMSIAQGELQAALDPWVAEQGPLDLIAFDACNMGSWEVAHALREHALTLVGSESWIGYQGLQYAEGLAQLRDDPTSTGAALADRLARTEVELGQEPNASAIDLSHMDALAAEVDALALSLLAAGTPVAQTLRDEARSGDATYHDWFMDLRDVGAVASLGSEPTVAAAGSSLVAAMDTAVIGAYGDKDFDWSGGLTIFMDTTYPMTLEEYAAGQGASWAQATHWDELLLAIHDAEIAE